MSACFNADDSFCFPFLFTPRLLPVLILSSMEELILASFLHRQAITLSDSSLSVVHDYSAGYLRVIAAAIAFCIERPDLLDRASTGKSEGMNTACCSMSHSNIKIELMRSVVAFFQVTLPASLDSSGAQAAFTRLTRLFQTKGSSLKKWA